MRVSKIIVVGLAAASLSLGGCLGSTAAPPQLPGQVTTISRTAVDFALNAFDAALYGLDWAMAAGKLTPGSPKAQQIAAAGRKVQAGLRLAEAARDAGNSASYEAAFQQANRALSEFRTLIGSGGSASLGEAPNLSPAERDSILARASS